MEDLLASIRKAIHEDIGEMPAPAHARQHHAPTPVVPAPAAPRASDELAAAASEIQQLREKISRARAGKPLPPTEPGHRAASLAAALQSETPRRNWREIEPPPPPAAAPRLRGTVIENEPAPKPAPRAAEPRPAEPRIAEVPAARLPARGEAPSMLSGNSAQAVHSAFSKLADSMVTRAVSERAVEEITRELLRVMLKQWLDENLPAMVERMVREEIERVARSGR